MRSTRSTALTLALVSAAFVSTSAWAGYHSGSAVSIDDSTRTAVGTLSDVRNSADSVQYIGCQIWAYSGNNQQAHCSARNANGVLRQCTTNNQSLIAIIASVQASAELHFRWDSNGQCSMVETYLSSYFATKK